MTDEQRAEFLAELTALTLKHRISIGACGCCSSPWVNDLTEGEVDGAYVTSGNNELEWKPK